MKEKIQFAFLAVSVILSVNQNYAQRVQKDYQDGKIIFQIREDALVFIPADAKGVVDIAKVQFLSEISAKYGIVNVIQKHPKSSGVALRKTYEVQFRNIAVADALAAELSGLSFIKYAEKKTLHHLFFTPNDSIYPNQWHLPQINAAAAWGIAVGSPSIVVADVDNAVWTGHPDLAAHISPKSYDLADGDNDPSPPAMNAVWQHGTHTSGIIGASTDNTIGVASIGFGVTIMALKVTHDTSFLVSGETPVEFGAEGIVYAADSGARVINCSWGGSSSAYTQSVVDYAFSKGCLVVAAAGNSASSTPSYPAACTHAIAVASTGSNDVFSYFSNYGSWITVCAPGENIWSTIPNFAGTNSGILNYDYLEGTSMSSPLVAGLCGLMLSLNPSLTPEQVLSCLTGSCTNINSVSGNSGFVGEMGAGRINAQAALQCVAGISTPPVANFIADFVAVPPGTSLNFTDLSTNNPTSWSWTFTGAATTSSGVQNPSGIVYNTLGCWPVTLTVSNSSGTSPAVTKTCYITVTNGPVGYECDTISNIPLPVKVGELTYYSVKNGSTWGYLTGTNSYGDEANCDFYSSAPPAGFQITGALVAFAKAYAGNSSHTLSLTVWDNEAGFPTNVLANRTVPINSITAGDWNAINFDNPVNVTGPYYLGLQFDATGSPLDTVVIVSTSSSEVKPSTAWLRLNSGIWYSDSAAFSGIIISQAIAPILCQELAIPTGIKEATTAIGMNVYPNPSTGDVNVLFPSGFDSNLSLRVYNSIGELVAKADRADLQGGQINLNLSAENAGIYFIECRTDNGMEVKKVVLER